ncbi:hypothetical protein BJV78DRAFT_1253251 [Lactifluus subvellereus]|nr:hypothetical protein BJV78DRAFT_1253251 [Lactifluus subvellereus]
MKSRVSYNSWGAQTSFHQTHPQHRPFTTVPPLHLPLQSLAVLHAPAEQMSTPPPPYSLQPLPVYIHQYKSRSRSPPSSREMLAQALKRAQHAVHLDTAKSDLPATIAAYDEAIALLQRVVARRARKSGTEAEVERVTDIHDRYLGRVRELCLAHRIPLPHHVAPAVAETSPTSLPHAHPLRKSSSDLPPLPPRTALRAQLRLDPQLIEDHETEWDAILVSSSYSSSSPSSSSSSSSSLTSTTISPSTPIDDSHDGYQWMVTAACDAEVEEWAQYLDEGGEKNVRTLVATATSSAPGSVTVANRESSYY